MATEYTFGARAVGSSWQALTADRKYASVFNMPVDGVISKISAYLAGGASSQVVRAAIYTDEARSPVTRKAQSPAVTIGAGQGSGWVDFVFSVPVTLPPGDYWLALIAGPTSAQASFFYENGPLFQLRSNDDLYSSGADDPWGEATTVNAAKLSITATYTLADATPPQVALTAPADGAKVSGSVTLTATASDDVGVTSVGFYRRDDVGEYLLASDSAAPYSQSWDTTTVADGAYELFAQAYDAAGNATRSEAVTVVVANLTDVVPPVGDVVTVELL